MSHENRQDRARTEADRIERIISDALDKCPTSPTMQDVEVLRSSIKELSQEVSSLRSQLAAVVANKKGGCYERRQRGNFDRKTAQIINPMIGMNAAETMETCARLAADISYLASLGDDVEVPLRNFYLIGEAVRAALMFEVGKEGLGGLHDDAE